MAQHITIAYDSSPAIQLDDDTFFHPRLLHELILAQTKPLAERQASEMQLRNTFALYDISLTFVK